MTDGEAGHMHGHGVAEAPDAADIAIDPVCGMKVNTATAKHRFEHDGRRIFFCSARCREKFIAAPVELSDQGAKPAASAPKGTIYTCPMHPQIRQEGPGSCPICGMALEPLEVPAETGPNAELIDMSRRFWIGLVLALPVVVLEMGGHVPALGLHDLVPPRLSALLQFAARDAGRAVGRLAVLRTRLGLGRAPQPQHVQPDRAGHRCGLCSTAWWRRSCPAYSRRGSAAWTARSPSISRRRRSSPSWCCSGKCWSCARASRPAARSGRCSTSRRRPHGG